MTDLTTQTSAIIGAWLTYCALHSLLASSSCKAWVAHRKPHWMPAYRLGFNALAVATLLPVLWLLYAGQGAWLWRWQGVAGWLMNGLALVAVLCFFYSTRAYDMAEFFGTRQIREQFTEEHQGFTLSGFHRFVRHPWYSISLVLIWTRDMNEPLLATALVLTAYFVVGSRLEESKLVAHFGESYRVYMKRVPALIPLPWKYLTKAEAEALVKRSSAHHRSR